MIKFLRISSVYPGFLKKIYNQIDKNDSYEKILKIVFEAKYSVSNYITEELAKKNYECNEIIHNFKFLQKKWLNQYGDSNQAEQIIFQQIKFYKPDVLFIGDINLINEKFISKLNRISNIKLILCFHCAPFNKKLIKKLNYVDSIITCTEGYGQKIARVLNKDVHIMHHAYKNYNHKIANENKRDIDIGFIGSLFLNKSLHIGRVDIIYELLKNFKNNYVAINVSKYFFIELIYFIFKSILSIKIFYNLKTVYKIFYIYIFSKKPIYGYEMYQVLNRTKILINKHIEDTEYAGNMRLFEATGSGCLLLTDNKKNLDQFFEINKDVVIFDDKNDLINKISYYLKYQDKIKKIAKKGKEKTISSHNYENRIEKLDIFIKKKLFKK